MRRPGFLFVGKAPLMVLKSGPPFTFSRRNELGGDCPNVFQNTQKIRLRRKAHSSICVQERQGFFGTANTNLNTTFLATYVFDTSNVGAGFGPGSQDIYGGSGYPLPDPLISATLVINGHTFSSNGSWSSESRVRYFSAFDAYAFAGNASNRYFYTGIFGTNPNSPSPSSVNSLFSYSYQNGCAG